MLGRPLVAVALAAALAAVAAPASARSAPATAPASSAPQALPASASSAESGSLSVLSYNVAGLPDLFNNGDPATNTPIIGARLDPYDVVHVQEDFNYHAALYAADEHPYRTPTSGGVPFGSGLNSLAHLPYDTGDFERVKWKDCSIGSGDCLTPKGFTYQRLRLAEGVWIDLYNVHADAGVEPGDLAARRANLAQLTQFIRTRSDGSAVIVAGDTNTRYTRSGDTIADFAAANGLTDAWVERARGGTPPAPGSPALVCDDAAVTESCEVVDKILYRGSKHLALTATDYRNDNAAFRDAADRPLSDHYPIAADFSWQVDPAFRMSDRFGGPHGDYFNDLNRVAADSRAVRLSLRAGARVDRIGLTPAEGPELAHGGNGGTPVSLTLAADEHATSLQVCQGKRNDRTRIFSARFTTSAGRTLSGGTPTSDCTTFTAPPGYAISGFHGRSGDELDKVGVLYTRQR
ncbi:jacalin-like lectin [Streptomyces sp. 549]|uniref:jacalin-like lectin n=1 Tax=Streptomyces sp. 549 TaxID=3049076 RepID=UPI0024C2515F|nr:jacalin-like lectin [Streptomyces sp. 549]MDK1475379.1 jacalin-like lectin [Streptomyces sp. 549]